MESEVQLPRSGIRPESAGPCPAAEGAGPLGNTASTPVAQTEALQAVGGCRGAVVTGTRLPEAIHRLALWVGGLSTLGAICTLRRSTSARAGQEGGPATIAATAFNGEVRMNHQDKLMPVASLPDNWSAFNDREVVPWQMSRADAAATLRQLD